MAKNSKTSDIIVSMADDTNFDAEDDGAVLDFMVSALNSLRSDAARQQSDVGINMFSSLNQQADFIAAAIQQQTAPSAPAHLAQMPSWAVACLQERGVSPADIADWDVGMVDAVSLKKGRVVLGVTSRNGWTGVCPYSGDVMPQQGASVCLVWVSEQDDDPEIVFQPGSWDLERPLLSFYRRQQSGEVVEAGYISSCVEHTQVQIAWLKDQIRQREKDLKMLADFKRVATHT